MDLNKAFENLESSIKESSTWTPSIILSSTMCTMVGKDAVFNMEKSAKPELVDVVKLLNPSPTQKVGASFLKYPNGAIFEIEGFTGTDKYGDVISHIKKLAKDAGTILIISQSKKNPSKRCVM